MITPGVLAVFLCSFWPVSIWYVERLIDKSDEPLGVLSLVAYIAIALSRREKSSPRGAFAVPYAAIVLVVVYVVTWPFAPKLLSAIFAVSALGIVLGAQNMHRRFDLGGWLLLIFSLPIVSSLNFYSGYPLRLVVGKIAAPLISMVGFPTIADGTTLIWGEHLVQIDAPCSGIKMLWFALFIGAVLTSVLELNLFRSAAVLSCCVVASLFGNVLRITSLFFVESGIVKVDPSLDNFVHQSVGAVAFAIAAVLPVLFAMRLSKVGRKVVESSAANADSGVVANSNQSAPSDSTAPAKANANRFAFTPRLIALLCSAVIAAFTPLVFSRADNHPSASADFPGWPSDYRGQPYQLVSPSKADEAFYKEFPGKIQCICQGKRRVVMRWVEKPTRQLHPSSDCFRGLGYDVTWKPLLTDGRGVRWSCFTATKDGRTVDVAEHIYDQAGQNWTDISSWYWAALAGRTHGPWRSDVEITPE